MNTPVALFARVSTARQQTDRQVSDLLAEAQKRHFSVVETFTETLSGTLRRADRPQLLALMELARSGRIKKVMVTEITRLGRRTVEVLRVVDELTELGVSVLVVNHNIDTLTAEGRRNPMASLMLTLVAEIGQLERETTVERIHSGLAEARRRGSKFGRPAAPVRTDDELIQYYPKVVRFLQKGTSIRKTALLAGVADKTVQKVKQAMSQLNLDKTTKPRK